MLTCAFMLMMCLQDVDVTRVGDSESEAHLRLLAMTSVSPHGKLQRLASRAGNAMVADSMRNASMPWGSLAAQSLHNSPSGRLLGSFWFSFCGPGPRRGTRDSFTPVFYPRPSANTASVNAGSYDLRVGTGHGGNKAFGEALEITSSQADNYLEAHTVMLGEAMEKPGQLVSNTDSGLLTPMEFPPDMGVLRCFARMPATRPVSGAHVGIVLINVLAPNSKLQKKTSDKNVAMVYVVGPNGKIQTDRDEFLGMLEELGKNIIFAVSEYNARVFQDDGLDNIRHKIEVVQMCLVSGSNIMRHPETEKVHVAQALVRGLMLAAAVTLEKKLLPEVRFAHDGNAFEEAMEGVQDLMDESSTGKRWRIEIYEDDTGSNMPRNAI